MEKRPPLPPMTPFDALTDSHELRLLKLMLPYTPPSYWKFLAFYIKFIELKNTVSQFRSPSSKKLREFQKDFSSPAKVLSDLKPYMGEEKAAIDSLLSALDMMKLMQDMDISDMPDMDDLSGMMDFMNTMTGRQNGENQKGDDENDHPVAESPSLKKYRPPEA